MYYLNSAVKSLVYSEFQGNFDEAAASVVSRHKVNFQSRQDSCRKDLLEVYKNSKF